MDGTATDERERQAFSLLDSLGMEWIKLPLAVMQDVGPAAQTFGGLLKLTNRETFLPLGEIASKSRVPIGTARKHLETLDAAGWINNSGRQRTRRGRPRRTCTIRLTDKARKSLDAYGVLPWWACCSIRKVGRLPWSARALLSIVMARLMALKAAAEREGAIDDAEDLIGAIESMDGDERFAFSLTYLEGQTGMTRETIVAGKRHLHRHRICVWSGTTNDADGASTDLLVPNWDFRVVETPAGPGRCYLDFRTVKG